MNEVQFNSRRNSRETAQDGGVFTLILVTTAITATLEAGLDGIVRVLAEPGIGITATRIATCAGVETFVRTSACRARTSRFRDGTSAGMVVAVTCLRLVQRQEDNG
jgi:hypothetical protein